MYWMWAIVWLFVICSVVSTKNNQTKFQKYLLVIEQIQMNTKEIYLQATVWQKSRHELCSIPSEETYCVGHRLGGPDRQEEVAQLGEDKDNDQEGVRETEPGGGGLGGELWWRLPCPVPAHCQLPP